MHSHVSCESWFICIHTSLVSLQEAQTLPRLHVQQPRPAARHPQQQAQQLQKCWRHQPPWVSRVPPLLLRFFFSFRTTAIVTIFRVRRPQPTPLMTTRRMIKLIPSNYYHLLVQRSLRQDIRFSNRARVLRQIRTYRTLLVRGSFMPWTTRTGRHGSRQGCMGATSTRVILRVLPQPIFCTLQQVVDSWRQEEENYSTLSCGAWADKQDIWWEEVLGGDCEGSVGLQSERDLLC